MTTRTVPATPLHPPRLARDLRPERRPDRISAMLLAGYWIAFVLYETVFAHVTLPGFFYPFYLAFLASILLTLLGPGLPLWRPALHAYVAFLLVTAVSFVGFLDPLGFDTIQRVVAYLLGLLATLQIRSREGLHVVTTGILTSTTILAAWIVLTAIQEGFTYRAGIATDPNVATFYLAPGILAAAALLKHVATTAMPQRWLRLTGMTLVTALPLYATLLLASRGMTLALALALGTLALHGVRTRPRQLLFLVLLASLTAGAFLLPGGQSLAERFTSERIETGGQRTPIWRATWTQYTQGTPRQLLLGHGFDASKRLVQNAFGSLTSTHNAYLQLLYELGALGLVTFLALHALPLLRAPTLLEPWGSMTTGLITLLLGANASVNAPDGFLYWTILAFALAIATWAPREGAPPQKGRTHRA